MYAIRSYYEDRRFLVQEGGGVHPVYEHVALSLQGSPEAVFLQVQAAGLKGFQGFQVVPANGLPYRGLRVGLGGLGLSVVPYLAQDVFLQGGSGAGMGEKEGVT